MHTHLQMKSLNRPVKYRVHHNFNNKLSGITMRTLNNDAYSSRDHIFFSGKEKCSRRIESLGKNILRWKQQLVNVGN